ncbi:MAG: c-type cytochrome [Curvibacter sp.]|nr:c-type cytochrome [Curvibacter sp.]
MLIRTPLLLGALMLLGSQAARADADLDAQMKTLALKSGCMTCHHIESGSKSADGSPPVGPNWQDVAQKYRGQAQAQEALVRTVLQGSNPYSSHWKGKASGLAMPPNAVAISQPDAEKLVGWILALP